MHARYVLLGIPAGVILEFWHCFTLSCFLCWTLMVCILGFKMHELSIGHLCWKAPARHILFARGMRDIWHIFGHICGNCALQVPSNAVNDLSGSLSLSDEPMTAGGSQQSKRMRHESLEIWRRWGEMLFLERRCLGRSGLGFPSHVREFEIGVAEQGPNRILGWLRANWPQVWPERYYI